VERRPWAQNPQANAQVSSHECRWRRAAPQKRRASNSFKTVSRKTSGLRSAVRAALDHSHENDFVGDIAVATCKPKAHASHFATAGMRLDRCRGCHNGNLRPILNVESR
jgi:hypothetical protein